MTAKTSKTHQLYVAAITFYSYEKRIAAEVIFYPLVEATLYHANVLTVAAQSLSSHCTNEPNWATERVNCVSVSQDE